MTCLADVLNRIEAYTRQDFSFFSSLICPVQYYIVMVNSIDAIFTYMIPQHKRIKTLNTCKQNIPTLKTNSNQTLQPFKQSDGMDLWKFQLSTILSLKSNISSSTTSKGQITLLVNKITNTKSSLFSSSPAPIFYLSHA